MLGRFLEHARLPDDQPPSANLVREMNLELEAANRNLVGNSDLLRAVLAGSGDCIKVLDLEGRLQFMSDGGKRVMEVDDFSKLKGCPWPDFWEDDGHQQAVEALAGARAGKTMRFCGPANTAKGNSRHWDVQVSPIFGPDGAPSQLLSISRDITDEWAANERTKFLADELAHRAKNSFAMVIAIAQQTFLGAEHRTPLETYTSRVVALSKGYDAVTATNSMNAEIRDVIEVALEAHERNRFKVSGPDLKLNPKQALSVTLAVNELATHAVKYGALSSVGGSVDISWSTSHNEDAVFQFLWRERGGPTVVEPMRQGFGTRVIKDLLAHDFDGVVKLTYDPAGFSCELTASLGNLPDK